MPQETPLPENRTDETWGKVGEFSWPTKKEKDPKKPIASEDPESPDLMFSKRVTDGYKKNHKDVQPLEDIDTSDQLPQ